MNQADVAFLTMVIPHHKSAIVSAERVLQAGDDPEVKRMARAIIDTQSTEITAFQRLLATTAARSMGEAIAKDTVMRM